jgi:hypothetical protein
MAGVGECQWRGRKKKISQIACTAGTTLVSNGPSTTWPGHHDGAEEKTGTAVGMTERKSAGPETGHSKGGAETGLTAAGIIMAVYTLI